MTALLQDVRYALRQLRKSPGFTATAVLTLALGIGANTAIFSLINAIMLRTVSLKNPQQLVLLKWKANQIPTTVASSSYGNCPHGGGPATGLRATLSDAPLDSEGCSFSFPFFQRVQGETRTFSSVAGFVQVQATVNFDGRTSQAQALFVSGDFFTTLAIRPALGRLLAPLDDSRSAAPAIVVSHRFWQNQLGADPAVVGKRILVGNTLFTVAGVAAAGLPDLDPGVPCDLWLPLAFRSVVPPSPPQQTAANALWIEVLARLRPAVTMAQAASTISVDYAASTTNGPDAIFKPADAPHIELSTLARGLATLSRNFSPALFTLLAAVAIVLLISCANLAGLMLARAAARRKELATRLALGATRARILRQMLTESLLVSLIGGAAGIALGYLGAGALVSFLSRNWYVPVLVDVRPDARVLLFTSLVSVLVGVGFGLAPAFAGRRVEVISSLKAGDQGSASTGRRGRFALGSALVAVQVVLTMLVLTGAGLLARTLINLRNENVGFDPQKVVVFRADATYSSRGAKNPAGFYRDLQEQLSALPGVVSASRSGVLLISGGGMAGPVFAGRTSDVQARVHVLPVSANFFTTMHIPLRLGRALNEQDSQAGRRHDLPAPVVVNELLARRLFPGENPLGKSFHEGSPDGPVGEIVGVVADAKYDNVRAAIWPTVYTSVGDWTGEMYFEVRSAIKPEALMPEIRSAVGRFDSALLLADMKTQTDQIDQNIYQERLIADLSGLFALLALLVACVGIYGLLSFQVASRTHEMGIRLALGAQREDLLHLVVWQGAALAILGALIGVGAALLLSRYLQSFLFGVTPYDPLTMMAVTALLIGVALLASYIPARRATRVDPMVALRYE